VLRLLAIGRDDGGRENAQVSVVKTLDSVVANLAIATGPRLARSSKGHIKIVEEWLTGRRCSHAWATFAIWLRRTERRED
jgi:hypothetical protein